MRSAPIHRIDGKVTLSAQAFRLDDRKRIYRRPRTFRDRALEFLVIWGMPAAALLVFAASCIVTWWLVRAIGRALGSP